MSLRRRSAVVVASTAVGLAAAGGVAYAVDDDTPDEDELTRPGTVTVDEEALPDDDVAEQEALAALATVDRSAAEAAGIESLGGGELVETELEEEDGFVVWEITVRATDGSLHEVTVDAGDGGVLGSEPEDGDDEGDEGDDLDDD